MHHSLGYSLSAMAGEMWNELTSTSASHATVDVERVLHVSIVRNVSYMLVKL